MKIKKGDYIRYLDNNSVYKVERIDWEDDSILATLWNCRLIVSNDNFKVGRLHSFTESAIKRCKKLTKDEYMVEIL